MGKLCLEAVSHQRLCRERKHAFRLPLMCVRLRDGTYREYSDRLRVVDTVFGKPPDREFLTLYRHHDSSLFHAAVSPGCIFFNRISTFFHRLCIITSRPDHMRGSDVCTVLYIIVILPSDTSCAFARVLPCLMVF